MSAGAPVIWTCERRRNEMKCPCCDSPGVITTTWTVGRFDTTTPTFQTQWRCSACEHVWYTESHFIDVCYSHKEITVYELRCVRRCALDVGVGF